MHPRALNEQALQIIRPKYIAVSDFPRRRRELFQDKIDESRDFRREVLAVRINGMDILLKIK